MSDMDATRKGRLNFVTEEWAEHREHHDRCVYSECPGNMELISWLHANGFSGRDFEDHFSGRDSHRPNFWSDFDLNKNPVADSGESVGDRKRVGTLKFGQLDHQVYRDAVGDTGAEGETSDAPESHRKAPLSAGSNDWVPEAMEYYKDRLDTLETTVHGVIAMLSEIQESLVRVEDALNRE